MEWQFFLSVLVFAIVMTGTPGPNNVMLTASGANFGYKRSIPHFLGISLGLISMIFMLAAGLSATFKAYPEIQEAMKWMGSAYILYLALKIAKTSPVSLNGEKEHKPMSFLEAAIFQYMNPKAWMMMVTAIGSFSLAGESYWLSVAYIALIFFITQLHTSSLWVGFGSLLGRWLSNPSAWRRFNFGMGALTASCVAFMW
ncbi:LysE family translocator [Vibrio hannami]|uniref:LysE family translocator n=1 Tax=Vibrio hannami TaxID=2717094 RepID=UPI00240ED0A3|nr:LysE family translocator [Vibrio hannami]MDG3086966.1 LysE family translocator [Vibrio hannami]